MCKESCMKTLLIFMTLFSTSLYAENYMIYSISQEFPMGLENEILKKNYYVNIGSSQGIEPGTELSVYRLISRTNPFSKERQERINYKVKIGQIKVIHSEKNHAIAELSANNADKLPTFFEVNSLMIGDHVNVKVD